MSNFQPWFQRRICSGKTSYLRWAPLHAARFALGCQRTSKQISPRLHLRNRKPNWTFSSGRLHIPHHRVLKIMIINGSKELTSVLSWGVSGRSEWVALNNRSHVRQNEKFLGFVASFHRRKLRDSPFLICDCKVRHPFRWTETEGRDSSSVNCQVKWQQQLPTKVHQYTYLRWRKTAEKEQLTVNLISS